MDYTICEYRNKQTLPLIVKVMLYDENAHLRLRAAETIGEYGSNKDIKALTRVKINDKDDNVRKAASCAIEKIITNKQ